MLPHKNPNAVGTRPRHKISLILITLHILPSTLFKAEIFNNNFEIPVFWNLWISAEDELTDCSYFQKYLTKTVFPGHYQSVKVSFQTVCFNKSCKENNRVNKTSENTKKRRLKYIITKPDRLLHRMTPKNRFHRESDQRHVSPFFIIFKTTSGENGVVWLKNRFVSSPFQMIMKKIK